MRVAGKRDDRKEDHVTRYHINLRLFKDGDVLTEDDLEVVADTDQVAVSRLDKVTEEANAPFYHTIIGDRPICVKCAVHEDDMSDRFGFCPAGSDNDFIPVPDIDDID